MQLEALIFLLLIAATVGLLRYERKMQSRNWKKGTDHQRNTLHRHRPLPWALAHASLPPRLPSPLRPLGLALLSRPRSLQPRRTTSRLPRSLQPRRATQRRSEVLAGRGALVGPVLYSSKITLRIRFFLCHSSRYGHPAGSLAEGLLLGWL